MMIDLSFLKHQKVAVLGLGKSGMATAIALSAADILIRTWDDNPDVRANAASLGIPLVDSVTPSVDLLEGADMLVLSPGVYRSHPKPHPIVTLALNRNCLIVNDIDLLTLAQRKARYLGVTGTNGKSTTTAMIGHLLMAANVPCAIGGNLGIPALELSPLGDNGWYVLEVSSFQLETVSQARWDIGVFLNITPDHLDRYASMEDYVETKRQLFRKQPDGATAVIGIDDNWSRDLWQTLSTTQPHLKVVPISGYKTVSGGVYNINGILIDDIDGLAKPIANLCILPRLRGIHNWQNAAAAYAAARFVGVEPFQAASAIASFPGLRHRQEVVAEIDDVCFVNDSKATNAAAAAKALASYRRIYWIAGGRPKTDGIEPLKGKLASVVAAFLIGEAAERFRATIGGEIPVTMSGTLEQAVAEAFKAAHLESLAKGSTTTDKPVVLLSPACASFDQFSDFEARGNAFVSQVQKLAQQVSTSSVKRPVK
jgi:UDP-N-acetylmuramoylalanine--D-glutamate ligase